MSDTIFYARNGRPYIRLANGQTRFISLKQYGGNDSNFILKFRTPRSLEQLQNMFNLENIRNCQIENMWDDDELLSHRNIDTIYVDSFDESNGNVSIRFRLIVPIVEDEAYELVLSFIGCDPGNINRPLFMDNTRIKIYNSRSELVSDLEEYDYQG